MVPVVHTDCCHKSVHVCICSPLKSTGLQWVPVVMPFVSADHLRIKYSKDQAGDWKKQRFVQLNHMVKLAKTKIWKLKAKFKMLVNLVARPRCPMDSWAAMAASTKDWPVWNSSRLDCSSKDLGTASDSVTTKCACSQTYNHTFSSIFPHWNNP